MILVTYCVSFILFYLILFIFFFLCAICNTPQYTAKIIFTRIKQKKKEINEEKNPKIIIFSVVCRIFFSKHSTRIFFQWIYIFHFIYFLLNIFSFIHHLYYSINWKLSSVSKRNHKILYNNNHIEHTKLLLTCKKCTEQ